MTFMKPELTKDLAFLIVANEERQVTFLQCGFTYIRERIKVGTIRDKKVSNTSDL